VFDFRRLMRWLVVAAILSAVVATLLVLVSDASAVADALGRLNPLTVVLMLVLALVGFILRGLRWGRLMRLMGHPVSALDALYLHVAGQTMSVTPGRAGEVLKPWLSREVAGMPMSRGIPLLFAERVADLIAVFLLALGGLSALGGTTWVLVAGTAVVVAGTALAGSAWFHSLALRLVRKQEWARKHEASAQAISDTLGRALHWRVLVWSVAVSVLAWGLEGVGFALCLHELGFTTLALPAEVSVYGVATIAGAFSFLPGGIGLTEASMAGILVAAGMAASSASAATLVTRLATLWWSVALGWAALSTRPSLLRRLIAPGKGA